MTDKPVIYLLGLKGDTAHLTTHKVIDETLSEPKYLLIESSNGGELIGVRADKACYTKKAAQLSLLEALYDEIHDMEDILDSKRNRADRIKEELTND